MLLLPEDHVIDELCDLIGGRQTRPEWSTDASVAEGGTGS
jgi:hypothetical protein